MLYRDISILDRNFEVKNHMYVGTTADRISYVSSELPDNPEDFGDEYLGKGKLLMPGFYNAHAHSPMSLMRGYGENMGLSDWLTKRIFPFEDKLSGDAVYWGTLLCMAESLRFGIVSTQDMYYFVEDMARAVSVSGTKNNISRSIVNFDGSDFNEMDSVKEMKKVVSELHGFENGRILIDASLHGEYTSDEKTTRALADYTRENNLIMHVHVSETKGEQEECKARHNGKTPVEYLNDCGIFDTKTTAAHCVWIEGEDFDILKEKGVTVATNPISNLKLVSGIADTAKILKKGINLAIGTDSVASNNSLNFFEEMKTLALVGKYKANDPRVITPKEVLYAATRAGAVAQGRMDCGYIDEGMKADLIVIDCDLINLHPVHNMTNNLVYSTSGSDVVLTMVDGRILYKDGNYATIDKEKVIFEVEKATKNILSMV